MRNRPTLKLKHNANPNLSLRKMLLMGHEKVTNIELDGFNSAQNSFMINSSGSYALTNSKIWSKESSSSGGVSELLFPTVFYWSSIDLIPIVGLILKTHVEITAFGRFKRFPVTPFSLVSKTFPQLDRNVKMEF